MLTRDEILALSDISTMSIIIPETIPVWGGKSLSIKQLTRGEQDNYLKRRTTATHLRQDKKSTHQDISGFEIYGHDAWLCVRGCVNEDGSQMFTDSDIEKLNKKSGEAIGWIAQQIIKFSGMDEDEKKIEQEIKN